LIPRFGILGAGWATLASFLIWNALNLYFSTKFYALRFDLPRLLHSLTLGAALVAIAQFLPADMSPFVAWPLKGALAAAYPLLLVATGFLRSDEWRVVTSAWRMRPIAFTARRSPATTME